VFHISWSRAKIVEQTNQYPIMEEWHRCFPE